MMYIKQWSKGESLEDLSLEDFKNLIDQSSEQPCLNLVLDSSLSNPFQ